MRDRGEDNQIVLNGLGIELSPSSYRKYKSKLDLYGIRGLIPKNVSRWEFTTEVRTYAKGVMTAKPNGLTASQLKIPLEAEFERQFWFNVWNSDPCKTVILFVDNKHLLQS